MDFNNHLPWLQELLPFSKKSFILYWGIADNLEDGRATHSSILAWETPWMEELVSCSPEGHKESDMTEATEHSTDRAD